MIPTLAVSVLEITTKVFSRADTLAHPADLMENLRQLSLIWACIFLASGLLCMYHGYKYYRVVTVVMALLIGGIVGYGLGQRFKAEIVVGGCSAALLAVACWPFMKYAVAVMGGLVGAFVGANAWTAIAAAMYTRGAGADPNIVQSSHYWVGALLGLVFCGLLAFILFKFSVVFFTSVSGATLVLFGVMAILLQIPKWGVAIQDEFKTNAIVLPLLVIVPALIALILQEAKPEAAGGAKPAGKPA